MNDINGEFDKIVSNYDFKNKMIDMKYNHSLRVSNIAKQIAISLNMTKDDVELAFKCGLLHDIARFKQAIEYKTFIDSKSFDHGDMGVTILKENDYISNYENNKLKQKIILSTVKNHNKLTIEDNLDDKTILFCKIIRDADKVDILLTQGLFEIDGFHDINKNIYESYKNNKMVNNLDVTNKVENALRQIAFIFDLEFSESFKIIKENDIIKKIFNYLEEHTNSKYFSDIKNITYEYINNYSA